MESFSSILTVKCPGSFNSLVKVHRNVEYTKEDRVLGPPNVAFITSSKPCMRAKRYRINSGSALFGHSAVHPCITYNSTLTAW